MYIYWVNNKNQCCKAVIHSKQLKEVLKEFGTLEKWFDSRNIYHFGPIILKEINDDYCNKIKYN